MEKNVGNNCKKIVGLRLMDDPLFAAALAGSPEAAEVVLQILLEDPKLRVVKVIVQAPDTELYSQGVRVGVYAIDGKYRCVNAEMLYADSGLEPKRARYVCALADAEHAPTEDDIEDLPETYVITLCEEDPLGRGMPLYIAQTEIHETHQPFDDGRHFLYVNTTYTGEDNYGNLFMDLRANNPDRMHFHTLAKAAALAREAACTESGKRPQCSTVSRREILLKTCAISYLLSNAHISLEAARKFV